jgi:hypothetical protein
MSDISEIDLREKLAHIDEMLAHNETAPRYGFVARPSTAEIRHAQTDAHWTHKCAFALCVRGPQLLMQRDRTARPSTPGDSPSTPGEYRCLRHVN